MLNLLMKIISIGPDGREQRGGPVRGQRPPRAFRDGEEKQWR